MPTELIIGGVAVAVVLVVFFGGWGWLMKTRKGSEKNKAV